MKVDPQPLTDGQEGWHALLLGALLRDTTLAVAVVDAGGTMTLMSPGLEQLAGAPFEPVDVDDIATHFNVSAADGQRILDSCEEPLNRARAGEAFRNSVVSLQRQDGEVVFLRCSGTPLTDPDGRSLGGIVLFDDVTLEYGVTRAQSELRDRLITTINHELRTPLTSLVGHAEVLQDVVETVPNDLLPDQARTSIRAVVDAGERLAALAESVTTLCDLEEASRANRSHVNLSRLVAGRVRRHREHAQVDGVEILVAGPDDLEANLDERQVSRAIDALIDNALRHTAPRTAIKVRVASAIDSVVVEVADYGDGVAMADRARLVLPFERGAVDLTSPHRRGLGLAIARSVAIAHGGELLLMDNEPRGLQVRLVLGVYS